jgi:hypothetical protein
MAILWATNLLHFHLNMSLKKVSNVALFCLATVSTTFKKIGRFFPNHLVTLLPIHKNIDKYFFFIIKTTELKARLNWHSDTCKNTIGRDSEYTYLDSLGHATTERIVPINCHAAQ